MTNVGGLRSYSNIRSDEDQQVRIAIVENRTCEAASDATNVKVVQRFIQLSSEGLLLSENSLQFMRPGVQIDVDIIKCVVMRFMVYKFQTNLD